MANTKKEEKEKRIKTLEEAQLLLDSMLPPLKTYQRNINANASLTDSEKKLLLNIVIDFEDQSQNYNYKSALDDIKNILDARYRPSQNSRKMTSTGGVIYTNPPKMPFLIKQVIFFIAVSCQVYSNINYTQADICSNLKISHNFFSRLDRKFVDYFELLKYNQPEPAIPYNGHKNGILGVAIKYLVYQAGEYDYYVDIFGGSGAASTAVSRRNNTKYVYNEKDEFVYNLFYVIADNKLYLKLIESLEALQADLRGEKIWLDNVDFDTEIDEFYERKNKSVDTEDEETKIKDEYSQDIYSDYKDIIDYMGQLYMMLIRQDTDKKYQLSDGTEISVEELLKHYIYDTSKYGRLAFFSYLFNYKMIEDIARANTVILNGTTKNVDGKDIPKFVFEKKKEYFEYRFYKYFAYFENHYKIMSKKPQFNYNTNNDKVLAALVAVFSYGIAFRGGIGISAIVRMLYGPDGAKASTSHIIDRFINNDFKQLITDMHEVVKGTICENKDFRDVIYKYCSSINLASAYITDCVYSVLDDKNINIKYLENLVYNCMNSKINTKRSLFYSDSPYISTTGYGPKFTVKDMTDLIKALLDSGDKFIFSCRAVYGSEAGIKPSQGNNKKNKVIYESVFETFSKYKRKGQKLYVLHIGRNGRELKDTIKGNYNDEIMITNYKISEFKDEINAEDVSYTVHDFKSLLKEIIQYGNLGYTQKEKQAILKKIK